MKLLTPTQTIGPFPHEAWRWPSAQIAAVSGTPIQGKLLDGAGDPINDGWVEAWCPATKQWQRCATGEGGEYTVNLPAGQSSLMITIFARGLTRHLFTVVYTDANAAILGKVPTDRRASLIAKKEGNGYHWDICLQGANETVFFDYE
jgi:protocatechuate 3,4-dioxygenase alpha subunit